jgi:transcriptional regulator with XRE-family HTH domain
MSDFEYVRQRLPRPNDKAGLEAVAKGSGVSVHTLLKIAKGETEDPRTSTVNRLAIYYRAKESKESRRREARAA